MVRPHASRSRRCPEYHHIRDRAEYGFFSAIRKNPRKSKRVQISKTDELISSLYRVSDEVDAAIEKCR